MSIYIGIILVLLGYLISRWVVKYYSVPLFHKPITLATPENTFFYLLLSIVIFISGLVFLWIHDITIGIVSTIIVLSYIIYSIKKMQDSDLMGSQGKFKEYGFKDSDKIKSTEMRNSIRNENKSKIDEVDYYIEIGNRYYQEGRFMEAIKTYSQVLEIKQDFIGALINRANAYMQIGAFESAEYDISNAIKISPNNVDLYVNRGNIYVELFLHTEDSKSDLDLANKDFTKALELDNKCSKAYLMRGVSSFLLGHKVNAKADFEMAKQLDESYSKQCDTYLDLINSKS